MTRAPAPFRIHTLDQSVERCDRCGGAYRVPRHRHDCATVHGDHPGARSRRWWWCRCPAPRWARPRTRCSGGSQGLVPLRAAVDSPPMVRVLVDLIPFLPVATMLVATIRHYLRCDEYQRHLVLIVSALSFAAAMVTATAIALMQGAGIHIPAVEWCVLVGGMSVWGIGMARAGTR